MEDVAIRFHVLSFNCVVISSIFAQEIERSGRRRTSSRLTTASTEESVRKSSVSFTWCPSLRENQVTDWFSLRITYMDSNDHSILNRLPCHLYSPNDDNQQHGYISGSRRSLRRKRRRIVGIIKGMSNTENIADNCSNEGSTKYNVFPGDICTIFSLRLNWSPVLTILS